MISFGFFWVNLDVGVLFRDAFGECFDVQNSSCQL